MLDIHRCWKERVPFWTCPDVGENEYCFGHVQMLERANIVLDMPRCFVLDMPRCWRERALFWTYQGVLFWTCPDVGENEYWFLHAQMLDRTRTFFTCPDVGQNEYCVGHTHGTLTTWASDPYICIVRLNRRHAKWVSGTDLVSRVDVTPC